MDQAGERALWRGVEAAAVLLVLGFFLYSTREILNPLLLFVLLWAVLLPFRRSEGYSALVGTAGVLTLIWLLSSTGSLLAPFVLSAILAYTLDPLVDLLSGRRLSRALAIVLLTVPAIGLLGVVVLLIVPSAIEQLGELADEAPVFLQRVSRWLEATRTRLLSLDVPLIDEDQLVARLQSVDAAAVVDYLQERREALGAWVWNGVLGLGRGIGSALTVVGYVALTPVLTFYLLRDWDGLKATLAELLPRDRRDGVVRFASECDGMVARYLRGQVTVALIMGVVTGLGLWIARFPYAGTLGLIVAVFSIVPYLGLVLSLIPALFIALVSGSVGVSLLKVAVVYGGTQLLEGAVISPRIVGESVGLHPVLVLLALSVGGFFFGFVGLLIGVPAAAIGKLLVARGIERYKRSEVYRGEAVAES